MVNMSDRQKEELVVPRCRNIELPSGSEGSDEGGKNDCTQ